MMVLQRLGHLLLIPVHAFEDQEIRSLCVLFQCFAGTGVRGEDKGDAPAPFTEHLLRPDLLQADMYRFSLLEALPVLKRNAQGLRLSRIEDRLPLQHKPVAEARNAAVIHREGMDLQADQLCVPSLGRQLVKQHGIGKRRHNDAKPFHHPFEPFRPPDVKGLIPSGFFEAEQQPGKACAVIPVVMGQQQAVQAAETPAEPADTDLGPFPAVDQQALAVHAHIEGRQCPFRNRQRPAGPQGTKLKHCASLLFLSFPRPRSRRRAPYTSLRTLPRKHLFACSVVRFHPSASGR